MTKRIHHMVMNLETGEVRSEPMKARTAAEAQAELEALMHDCPECQAARARGEVPAISTPPMSVPLDEVFFTTATRLKRPRWRDLKRRVRR